MVKSPLSHLVPMTSPKSPGQFASGEGPAEGQGSRSHGGAGLGMYRGQPSWEPSAVKTWRFLPLRLVGFHGKSNENGWKNHGKWMKIWWIFHGIFLVKIWILFLGFFILDGILYVTFWKSCTGIELQMEDLCYSHAVGCSRDQTDSRMIC